MGELFFGIISLFGDILDQVIFRSFSSRKIYKKNPADTDEVRIQDTIFFLLKKFITFYKILKYL